MEIIKATYAMEVGLVRAKVAKGKRSWGLVHLGRQVIWSKL